MSKLDVGERPLPKTRRINTTQQLLKNIRYKKELDGTESLFNKYQSDMQSSADRESSVAKINSLANAAEYQKYMTLKKIDDIRDILGLEIIAYNEDEYPKEFDESVNTIDKAIKNSRSSVRKLLDEAGIDTYDIAYNAYKLTTEGVGTLKTIDLKPLLENIEIVSDNALKIAIKKLEEKKKPFFF